MISPLNTTDGSPAAANGGCRAGPCAGEQRGQQRRERAEHDIVRHGAAEQVEQQAAEEQPRNGRAVNAGRTVSASLMPALHQTGGDGLHRE